MILHPANSSGLYWTLPTGTVPWQQQVSLRWLAKVKANNGESCPQLQLRLDFCPQGALSLGLRSPGSLVKGSGGEDGDDA